MPVCGSGVMFEVNSVPNGVFIGRPPAKVLPSRAVWQAMQSPARARYSPFASSAGSAGCCCATAGAAPTSADVASAAKSILRVFGICAIPSVRLAAARQRHRQAAAPGKRRVRRRRARRQKVRNRPDVVFGQKAGNDLHAIGGDGGTRAISPGPELAADIAGAQAEQARYRRLHAAEGRIVASGARRDAALWIALGGKRFAARQNFIADGGNGGGRKRRPQRRKVLG